MPDTLTYAQLVAQALPHRPEMLAVARQNIARWLASGGHAPAQLHAWDDLLEQAQTSPSGLDAVIAILEGRDEARSRLLEFQPFAGVLPREARRKAVDLCTWRH